VRPLEFEHTAWLHVKAHELLGVGRVHEEVPTGDRLVQFRRHGRKDLDQLTGALRLETL
jgi:hypothetical protein